MKRIALLSIVFAIQAYGQFQNNITVTSGISFPTEPLTFYDYWKEGVSISVQFDRRNDNNIGYIIAGEFNSFLFDKSNFIKRLNITDRNTIINGATTIIMETYGAVEYTFPNVYDFKLEPFIGLGVMYIHVSESEVRYTFAAVNTLSDTKILFCSPYGLKIKTLLSSDLDIVLEIKKNVNISRQKNINSEFTSIRAGISLTMN